LTESSMSRRALAASLSLLPLATVAATDSASRHPGAAGISPADRAAIEDLYVRYMWSYDCNDEQGFLDLFTADAIAVGYPEMKEVYRTPEAMLGWFRFLTQLREKEGDDWQHFAYNHRFEGDAKRCVVYSYATHFNSNREKKTLGVRSTGYFVCECVNTAEGWRFRRFSINHWDRTRPPWTKPLPWADL